MHAFNAFEGFFKIFAFEVTIRSICYFFTSHLVGGITFFFGPALKKTNKTYIKNYFAMQVSKI